jgi:hypothetical protein
LLGFSLSLRKRGNFYWKTSFIPRLLGLVGGNSMIDLISLPVKVFAKSATCPSSEKLLAFAKSQLPSQTEFIVSHLEYCDFCRAELQLLKRFPARPEIIAEGEIPASLRTLAESILRTTHNSQPLRSFPGERGISH